MTWHTTTVSVDALSALLTEVRREGGIVVSSRPRRDRVQVTWTVLTGRRG